VFTKTLAESDWVNTVLATNDLVAEITALKEQDGQDVIVYGGASFVSSLIKHNLIDEYHLFVNPAAIGNGLPIFRDLDQKLRLNLVAAKAFSCGIVVLHYVSVAA
jgi:dihydrofolate reductase